MSFLDQYRQTVVTTLLVAAIGGGAYFYSQQPDPAPIEIAAVETSEPAPTETAAPTSTPAPVRVFVSGAVQEPDVYFLPQGSIIKDAVAAAGGFTETADWERINQAQEVRDQQQIHVPELGDEADDIPVIQDGAPPPSTSEGVTANSLTAPTSERINLNSATLEQLDTLPGIGPALGQRIIDYREQVGPFQSVEEVMQVSGIGEATFAELQPLISVE